MKMPQQAKSWFKYLVSAQAEIHTGRLDDAVESYNTILKSFALPDSEAYEIHLALGQVRTRFRSVAVVVLSGGTPRWCLLAFAGTGGRHTHVPVTRCS